MASTNRTGNFGGTGFTIDKQFIETGEIRKFMKKAELLNEVNYKKLHKERPLVPGNSTLNIYKSSKNILDEIGPDITTRDKQIRQIYLRNSKDVKRISNPVKKSASKKYPIINKRKATISK